MGADAGWKLETGGMILFTGEARTCAEKNIRSGSSRTRENFFHLTDRRVFFGNLMVVVVAEGNLAQVAIGKDADYPVRWLNADVARAGGGDQGR